MSFIDKAITNILPHLPKWFAKPFAKPYVAGETINEALNHIKILNNKKLGFLVVVNNHGLNTGVFTDGDLKRIMQKKRKIDNFKIKLFMTKKPYSVEENTLAAEILTLMNKKKITKICVYKKNNKKKITGVVSINNLLSILK